MLRSLQAIVVLLLLSAPASASTFGFECLTSFAACPAGETQIQLEVESAGADHVLFVLTNLGPSFDVEAVYLEANNLFSSLVAVTNTPDVGFFIGLTPGTPPIVPGGGAFSWPLVTSSIGFGSGAQAYLGAGEELVILAELNPGSTAQDVIAALTAGIFHVGVLLDDDGLITVAVPEPTLAALLGAAAVALLARRRRSA